jgi:hypothetical protein
MQSTNGRRMISVLASATAPLGRRLEQELFPTVDAAGIRNPQVGWALAQPTWGCLNEKDVFFGLVHRFGFPMSRRRAAGRRQSNINRSDDQVVSFSINTEDQIMNNLFNYC